MARIVYHRIETAVRELNTAVPADLIHMVRARHLRRCYEELLKSKAIIAHMHQAA